VDISVLTFFYRGGDSCVRCYSDYHVSLEDVEVHFLLGISHVFLHRLSLLHPKNILFFVPTVMTPSRPLQSILP